ncbi:mannose-1-phosphate guanylyltransferase [Paludibacter sp. 221]|uniref:mannose-1-phosphate guanylyltransferase n=1 Tax=Paludibacter sp. 221 TaxID=2302939 RepID=UPI0013D1127D|nr:mannose-1-phosphate guanylyltransferase [Paludibacter sp. 221]NDV46684.1 mannose-1-phosphate guanylyltransferase [Paludibacter sp. 221]
MENNYCIIMAGGVGSRFWPFSRNDRPKQFLDFFGTGRSLLQLTFDRFRHVVPAKNILIVTNHIYKELIMEQLPEIQPSQILLEPHRRNTAPCIAYAVSRIKSITDKANIIVTPSDHLILKETEFLDTIREGLNFIEANDSLLTLGIKPSRPETGYGYIQIDEGAGNLRKVKTFTEKPNAELAQVFFETGEFFWNSGIFLWNLDSIDSAFQTLLPEIADKFNRGKSKMNTDEEQSFINEIYPTCPNISIDYGIMEKASNVYVLCSDFGWTDLGTWGSLYDMSNKDEQENVTLKCQAVYYESQRNIIALPSDKLVVAQGLEDYIVAESDNVLLICKKEEEQRIRQFVNDVNIMFDGKYN